MDGDSSMENYEKGEVKVMEDDWKTLGLEFEENVVHMKVSGGSKIRNLMGYAMKKVKDPEVKQLTWNASGHAIGKAISCAEIMKRRVKDLHQVNKIRYLRIEEYWEPKMSELERLKVNRDIPAITILLSKDELDTSIPGYQAPGSVDTFLHVKETPENQKSRGDKRKNPRPVKNVKGATSVEESGTTSWTRDKKGKKKDISTDQTAKKRNSSDSAKQNDNKKGRGYKSKDNERTEGTMDT